MQMPRNMFKANLTAGRHQVGIWNSIGGNTAPEVLATSGFDWIVVDTEHSSVEVTDVLPALQAIAGYPDVSAVVRPDSNDPVVIKRVLDFGAQTLIVPYVQNAEEARLAVASMHYPPRGFRGVAGSTRASRFGAIQNYTANASQELCLIVQVETGEALGQLEEIAGVDGVDAVFIGPSDLSTSLGYPGQIGHPDVKKAIFGAFERLARIGVPSGVLAVDEEFARECIDHGTAFTAIGTDVGILAKNVRSLRERFR